MSKPIFSGSVSGGYPDTQPNPKTEKKAGTYTWSGATFFWNNKTNNSDDFKIIQSINVNNTETFGVPNITFYGAYNYSGNSNLNNVAGLCIDYLYFRIFVFHLNKYDGIFS